MKTKKGYKATIYWKKFFEKEAFIELLRKNDEKYTVLIIKGRFSAQKPLFCIMHSEDMKENLVVQDLLTLQMKNIPLKNVCGFALLNQRALTLILDARQTKQKKTRRKISV
jgi:hypothetical protein